jgi:hypothetical protein
MRLLNLKVTNLRIIARTKEIKIGQIYFLSSFYEKDGAMVEVLSKSTKLNSCGWPSSVSVKVIEPLGSDVQKPFYATGTVHSVNATNLYERREDAGAKKYSQVKVSRG